jgi:hypothetical protein
MGNEIKHLPLDGVAILLEKLADDFSSYADMGLDHCPAEHIYKIASRDESLQVGVQSRLAALKEIKRGNKPILKVAFDTRRIDQEHERNPRTNLQYWHRADAFIDADDDIKLRRFARLMTVLADIKKAFGAEPEWFESYARVLYDTVHRILRIKQADLDIFKPQLSYLEQLVFTRYRLTMEDLETMAKSELQERLLSKDESLMKRGRFLEETGLVSKGDGRTEKLVIDGNKNTTQDSIVNAIFGNNGLRREGEKTVERTITITIRDQVLDD